MNSFINATKKTVFVLTAFLAGLFIYILISTYNINTTVLDSGFHRLLFEKHDIYEKTHSVINSSINQYIGSLRKASPADFEQHNEIFDLLQKSITPDFVKTNLDSLREGLFQYFKSERKFLPDIYLNSAGQKNRQPIAKNADSNNNQTSPIQALSKIEKVNLSAILLYINRSDISDSLFKLKFLTYVITQAPGVVVLFLLLLALTGLYLCSRYSSISKWLAVFTLTGGVLTLISGIALFFYVYSVMPKSIYPLSISLPLKTDVIISYLSDCIVPIAATLTLFGIFLIVLSVIIFYLPVLIPILFFKNRFTVTEKQMPFKTLKIVRNTLFIFFCLIIISALFFKVNSIKADFEANDFNIAISKMKNANTVMQVISAKDEAVYTLHVKLVDKKNNMPIPNTKINVYGKSEIQDKHLNETISTDDTGTAKFTLDKGAFRVNFLSEGFPEEYEKPGAFYYELKSPGTTIITVNLEEPDKTEQQATGIAEIEILDKENKPVQGIEFTIEGIVNAPGFPNNIYSISNSEGIAVFKISPGTYKINFVMEKFPKQYVIPVPIDATVTQDAVTRYTIRLVDTEKEKGLTKP